MGDIKKVLHLEKVSEDITPIRMSVDLCENVHLHVGEFRLEFTWDEWNVFCENVKELQRESIELKNKTKWVPKADSLFRYTASRVLSDFYYPDRLSIEWQKNGDFHFHFRNFRLHSKANDFFTIMNGFINSKQSIENYKEFPYNDTKERKIVKVPIDTVQPYDCGHMPGVFDDYHREGIEMCKELIKQGKRIRPIAVLPNGQRLDGFKRYFAQKELGITDIEVEVIPNGAYGCQNATPFTTD
jgi:hypothetical protein